MLGQVAEGAAQAEQEGLRRRGRGREALRGVPLPGKWRLPYALRLPSPSLYLPHRCPIPFCPLVSPSICFAATTATTLWTWERPCG